VHILPKRLGYVPAQARKIQGLFVQPHKNQLSIPYRAGSLQWREKDMFGKVSEGLISAGGDSLDDLMQKLAHRIPYFNEKFDKDGFPKPAWEQQLVDYLGGILQVASKTQKFDALIQETQVTSTDWMTHLKLAFKTTDDCANDVVIERNVYLPTEPSDDPYNMPTVTDHHSAFTSPSQNPLDQLPKESTEYNNRVKPFLQRVFGTVDELEEKVTFQETLAQKKSEFEMLLGMS
jgi:hypothetical protein